MVAKQQSNGPITLFSSTTGAVSTGALLLLFSRAGNFCLISSLIVSGLNPKYCNNSLRGVYKQNIKIFGGKILAGKIVLVRRVISLSSK